MRWHDANKYKPKDNAYVWVWDIILQKQQLFISKCDDGRWDVEKLPANLARMWAYVFSEDFEVFRQPQRIEE